MVFGKFHEIFGFYPTSTGSYYMDAELVYYIKEKYPMVKAAVETCWEEGSKAYWNANNPWYTLLHGGPWIPSKHKIHCIASEPPEPSLHAPRMDPLERHPLQLKMPDVLVRRLIHALLPRHESRQRDG